MYAADAYFQAKRSLEVFTGADPALLHVYAGLAIFALAALLVRGAFHSPWPLVATVAFALANEGADIASSRPWAVESGLVDIANTLFWPVVLTSIARLHIRLERTAGLETGPPETLAVDDEAGGATR